MVALLLLSAFILAPLRTCRLAIAAFVVAPTVQIFGVPEGTMTCVRNEGTMPVFQLAAVFQSVLTVPVQVATSRMILAKAVSLQPVVLVAISR